MSDGEKAQSPQQAAPEVKDDDDQHHNQFESTGSGASLVYPMQCSALRKGGFVPLLDKLHHLLVFFVFFSCFGGRSFLLVANLALCGADQSNGSPFILFRHHDETRLIITFYLI
jgi:hypothetical protein